MYWIALYRKPGKKSIKHSKNNVVSIDERQKYDKLDANMEATPTRNLRISTNAQRQARYAKKQKQLGLKKVSIWLTSERAEQVKDWIEHLNEYTPLQGSERQVAWADQIRNMRMRQIALAQHSDKSYWIGIGDVVRSTSSAKFFIETRRITLGQFAEIIIRESMPELPITPGSTDTQIQKTEIANATLIPEGKANKVVLEASLLNHVIYVRSVEFYEPLAAKIKPMGFVWNSPAWQKPASTLTHECDQFVEIVIDLLAAGYTMRVFDEQIRTRVIKHDYEPAPENIVDISNSEKYGKKFYLRWKDKITGIQGRMSNIPGIKIFDNAAYLPLSRFEEVQDIANCYGFILMPAVQQAIAEAEELQNKSIGVVARPKRSVSRRVANPLLVAPTGEIDESLLDN